jgi:hypothetical protein
MRTGFARILTVRPISAPFTTGALSVAENIPASMTYSDFPKEKIEFTANIMENEIVKQSEMGTS